MQPSYWRPDNTRTVPFTHICTLIRGRKRFPAVRTVLECDWRITTGPSAHHTTTHCGNSMPHPRCPGLDSLNVRRRGQNARHNNGRKWRRGSEVEPCMRVFAPDSRRRVEGDIFNQGAPLLEYLCPFDWTPGKANPKSLKSQCFTCTPPTVRMAPNADSLFLNTCAWTVQCHLCS